MVNATTPATIGAASDRTASPPAVNTRRLRYFKSVILFTLLLIVLGSTIWLIWRHWLLAQQLSATQTGITQLQTQVARQQAQLTELLGALPTLQDQSIAQQAVNSKLLDDLKRLTDKIRYLAGNHSAERHLVEVEALLRLANQRLLMAADVIGAKQLLARADEVLGTTNDYTFYPIRAALADDMAALSRVAAIDVVGTFLALKALGDQVPLLTALAIEHFKPTMPAPAASIPPADTALTPEQLSALPEPSDWQTQLTAYLLRAWQQVTGLFKFTAHTNRPVTVLPSLEQEALMRQQIRWLIEQGKWALLAHQPTVYQDSLSQAITTLQHYFAVNDTAQAMIITLRQLTTLTMTLEWPDISHALDAIERYRTSEAASPKPLPGHRQSSDAVPTTDNSTNPPAFVGEEPSS